MSNKTLTTKQRKFVNFYEGNATKAAILAGFSKKTARSQGQRLLTKVDIIKALKKREERETGPLIANRQERQRFWTAVLRGKLPKAKVKVFDRLKASELLGKSEADFTEKILHTGLDNLADRIKQARQRAKRGK